ncbi:MAG: DoxX family membrane protein [Bacillota bacterium]
MLKWFRSKESAWFWLIVRVYVGWQWLEAGWHKVAGPQPFDATGFLKGAIQKATGDHPAVQPWYAAFLENVALPNVKLFNFLVAYGEVLVGLALILGFASMFAAFMGAFMNLNFMLAGTTSTNPILYTLQVLMLAAGSTAVGYWGVDRWFLPVWRQWVANLLHRSQPATAGTD